ncbi:EAL domain-containing protein [Aquincola sp. J276]|uniref:EAL domain-containing protein n=1 Tax=Aquincola sp. J276 TaxID=2898432 RepID=UPI0021506ECD|nr:EAL domain-containing protein [Aquincola sp. J276]MCR5867897.1 EAL domain-containing protein [Aquincola sp. J276]
MSAPAAEALLPLLPDSAQCGHLYTADNGLILRANALVAQWCGRPLAEIEGRLRLQDVLSPGSRIFHETHYTPLLQLQGFAHEISFDFRAPDGRGMPVLAHARVQPAKPGQESVTSITLFSAEATRRHERALRAARRQAEDSTAQLALRHAQLQAQTERLRVTLQSLSDAVITTDAQGRIDSMNPPAHALLGVAAGSLCGCPFAEAVALLSTDDRLPLPSPVLACLQQRSTLAAGGSVLLLRADGSLRRVQHSASPILDAGGGLLGMVWVAHDVTEQHRQAERVERELRQDALTGLMNRREFERLLAPGGRPPAQAPGDLLCHLDLDQFKVINDTVGHAAGDALLAEIGRLLQAGTRHSDVVARLGADEFGLILARCGPQDGIQRCEALRERIAAHRFVWLGLEHRLTASIGIAPLLRSDGNALRALSDADVACHAAKEAGRNRVHFAAEADAQVEGRRGEMHWVAVLRRALAEDRFELHGQPIVGTGAALPGTSHCEVLLRLRGDDGRLVPPALFIPAAERYQLMGELDRWVFRHALAWMQATPAAHCAINVSGQSLGDATFLTDVLALFEAHDVDPRRVCFEITETAAIGNLEAAHRFIAAWRKRGARFALDDFGVGLSSFSYLRQLAVDVVKIDGSFVKDMHTDAQNRAIVESIHRVAMVCGLQTVAEWVENADILSALQEIGVHYAQGWHTGRPALLD